MLNFFKVKIGILQKLIIGMLMLSVRKSQVYYKRKRGLSIITQAPLILKTNF
jgi:hypothetical protein